jgi:hypothetical protein
MKNGFTVVGTHAPAMTETFDPELGRQRAYEHAIGQLKALTDFAMRGTIPLTIKIRVSDLPSPSDG